MKNPLILEDSTIVQGNFADQKRTRGVFETVSNVVSLSSKDTSREILGRMMDLGNLNNDGEVLQPEQLREKFPGNDDLLNYPLTEAAAESLVKEREQRANLEFEIAAGPKGGVYTALNFAAGMIPHAIDPIDMAVGFGIGKALMAPARGAKVLKMLRATKAGRVGADIGIAAAGNIAVEPGAFISASLESRDYTMMDMLANSVGGAVIGVGLIKGAGAVISPSIKSFNKFRTRGARGTALIADSVAAQMNSGRMVDFTDISKDMIREYTFSRESFERFDFNNADVGTKVYGAVPDGNSATTLAIGEDFGEGLVYLTPDRSSANGVAGSKYSEGVGSVAEIEIRQRLNLLDADVAVTDLNVREILARHSANIEGTLREAFESVPDKQALTKDLANKGYDGIYHDNRGEGANANVIALFNNRKLAELSRTKADVDSVPRASERELLEIGRAEQQRQDSPFESYETDMEPGTRLLSQTEPVYADGKRVDVSEALKNAEDLHKSGVFDKDTLDSLKDFSKDMDGVERELGFVQNCLGRIA